MDESVKVNAFEGAFEAWLSKTDRSPLHGVDDVETGSICSQTDKNNNTDSDVDGDLPSGERSPSVTSQQGDVQNNNKLIRLVNKRLPKLKPSMTIYQAIKRKYFSIHAKTQRHASLKRIGSNKIRSALNSLPTNDCASTTNETGYRRCRKLTNMKATRSLAKCHTSSYSYTASSRAGRCLGQYGSHRASNKCQFKSSVGAFTDSHGMSVSHSTEVSPVSDAGYGEDVTVDSEHDDISRRSNGYHSMEEFQLTSVSPPSQSESPLSSAGEGNHAPFLCSKSSSIGYNLQSMYIDRRVKSARKNHSPNSYDADSDFVESPHSCHIPPSKSPSHMMRHCNRSKSPDHTAVPPGAKQYKRDCQRDSERPLILKIKCERSPLHQKSPIYFCENITPTDSPSRLKLIDSEKNGHVLAATENNSCRRKITTCVAGISDSKQELDSEKIGHLLATENNSCRTKITKCVAGISDSNQELEQTRCDSPHSGVESLADRLCECDSANKELATSPDHSCGDDDAVLEKGVKIPRLNRQKSRRNSSRVCTCCMSSPKRHRLKGEKRKRSLSTSNTPGSIVFTSGSTSHLKCDVTHMSPNEKKFVKSALNLSSLQQKLHILFIHLFPRLEPALVQMPPESLRFTDMLDEVIKTLEGSPEDETRIDSEELSKQLLCVSLKADASTVTVFEPQVQMCNVPKDCLEEFQEKIYTLLKLLLPDLTMKYEYVLRFPKDLEKFLDRVLAWNYRL